MFTFDINIANDLLALDLLRPFAVRIKTDYFVYLHFWQFSMNSSTHLYFTTHLLRFFEYACRRLNRCVVFACNRLSDPWLFGTIFSTINFFFINNNLLLHLISLPNILNIQNIHFWKKDTITGSKYQFDGRLITTITWYQSSFWSIFLIIFQIISNVSNCKKIKE